MERGHSEWIGREPHRWAYTLAALLSVLYVIYGALQLYNGIADWWFPWMGGGAQLGFGLGESYVPNVFPDPFSGLALVVIGAIFARAFLLFVRREESSRGFLFVGWILALMMLILNLTVLLADILDTYYPLIWGGEVEMWTLGTDPWGISPHLVLGAIAALIYPEIRDVLRQLVT